MFSKHKTSASKHTSYIPTDFIAFGIRHIYQIKSNFSFTKSK